MGGRDAGLNRACGYHDLERRLAVRADLAQLCSDAVEMLRNDVFHRHIAADCGCAVLLKGGHSDTDADDLLTFPDGTEIWFPGKRIANPNTHGTGCTLSSAIAANLAKGFAPEEAIARAKAYLTDALNAQLDLGRGSGPLDHTLGGVGVENWMHGVPDAVQDK